MTLTRNEYVKWMYSNNFDTINDCSYLIPKEHIVRNNEYLANISFPPNEIQNLTKDIINARAETFFYLNSCIKNNNSDYWYDYYRSLFRTGQSSVTYSGSGIFLNLLRIIKTSSEDGREIGKKVLKKLKSMVALKNFGSDDFKERFHNESLSSKMQSKNKDYNLV